jgi:hypothetical protein
MALKRRRILEQALDLGYGTAVIPADSGGNLVGDKIGLHTFSKVLSVKSFGAYGDNIHDDTEFYQDALLEAQAISAAVMVPPGFNSAISAKLTVPAGVLFFGHGRLSKLTSYIPLASVVELVMLAGDYAAIQDMWLHGTGQHANDADGNRGIWIGSADDHSVAANGMVAYARIENVYIDNFRGNGISGHFTQARILHNHIHQTTDSGMHIEPWCTDNLVFDNDITDTRYSGIDMNGARNQIILNRISDCGGGTLDLNSHNGILMAMANNSYPLDDNLVEGNVCRNNGGSGIALHGCTGAGITPAKGNIIRGNYCSGHTTVQATAHVPSGIAIWGGSWNTIEGNNCVANRDNYVITGAGVVTSCQGNIVSDNQSRDATRNGYLIAHTPRADLTGDYPVQYLNINNNMDEGAAEDSFEFRSSSLTFDQLVIAKNRSFNAGAYAFANVILTSNYDYNWDDNWGTGFGTAFHLGFDARGMAGATPDVINGTLFKTANAVPTTVTALTGGVMRQEITILVQDDNTTFDFTGTTLKGNSSVDLVARTGDVLRCVYNGTNWYCDVDAISGFPKGAAVGVTQLTSKTTGVTVNAWSGSVTMVADALADDAVVVFTMTNNKILGTSDQVIVNVIGGPNYGAYVVQASVTGVGTADISVRNVSTAPLSDAVIIGFTIKRQVI